MLAVLRPPRPEGQGAAAGFLADLLDGLCYVQHRGRVIVMLLTEIPRQPDLIEILEAPMAIAERVIALIARYQHEGTLSAEPPTQAYAALLGPIFL